MRLLSVVGARPNFMKLAPLQRELERRSNVEHVVVHTGQHYDYNMSEAFFDDLRIGQPKYNLDVGPGSHAQQTATIMERFEQTCVVEQPDLVLVYGDVNSTVAATLVATKLHIPVGHVEAGLRSYDRSMPEEVNRVVTDALSDWLFTPSRDADRNLTAEGVAEDRIHFVGNIMIDSLEHALPTVRSLDTLGKLELADGRYAVVTLHRPSNVDDAVQFGTILDALDQASRKRPVVFPLHPRTRDRIEGLGRGPVEGADVRRIDPMGYLEMLRLISSAEMVITDSGGLQEETSYLGIPCITLRPNTERPITCTDGTNQLVPPGEGSLLEAIERAPGRRIPGGANIDLWDGCAAARIADVVCQA